MLNAVAEQTSAKELVVACEESIERLSGSLTVASSDDDDDFEGDIAKVNQPKVTLAQQVARTLSVYARGALYDWFLLLQLITLHSTSEIEDGHANSVTNCTAPATPARAIDSVLWSECRCS